MQPGRGEVEGRTDAGPAGNNACPGNRPAPRGGQAPGRKARATGGQAARTKARATGEGGGRAVGGGYSCLGVSV
jgi:hypothetical protein